MPPDVPQIWVSAVSNFSGHSPPSRLFKSRHPHQDSRSAKVLSIPLNFIHLFWNLCMQGMRLWALSKLNENVNFGLGVLRAWVTFKLKEQSTVVKHIVYISLKITWVNDVFEIFMRQIAITLFFLHTLIDHLMHSKGCMHHSLGTSDIGYRTICSKFCTCLKINNWKSIWHFDKDLVCFTCIL